MTDLSDVYAALRKADASGNTADAKRLADYIRAQESTAADSSRKSPMQMSAITDPDIDPTKNMSGWERFMAGYGKAGHDIAQGVGKFGRDVIELVPGGEKAANALNLPNRADIAESRKLDAPLMSTTGGTMGNVAGNVADFAPMALLPGANTVIGGGLYGAAAGAAQPADDWQERGKNALTSGMMSSAITGATRAIPAIYRGFVSPFMKSGQENIALSTLNRFAKDPDAIKNALVNELIPGSKPSLAEVTLDPGIAQVQRAAQAKSPEVANLFADAHSARLQARKDALMGIAGQAGEKEALESVRDATANRLYQDAFTEPPAEMTPYLKGQVTQLLKRPSIQEAQKDAIKLAREEGMKMTNADAGSIKGLHYTKMALDDKISAAKRSGDDNLARVLMGTKEKLLNVMDDLSPKYKEARTEFAKASKPINTMEIGRYLYDKLFPAMSDLGAERLTPQKFAAALKEGDNMAKKATGFRGAKLRDLLTTDQLNTVINTAKDVGREAGAIERGKVPGSPTAQYLAGANLMRQMLGPLGLPESWVEKTIGQTFSSLSSKFPFNVAEDKIQNNLGRMMVDPSFAQSISSREAASAAKMLPLSELSRYAIPVAAIGGASSNAAQ